MLVAGLVPFIVVALMQMILPVVSYQGNHIPGFPELNYSPAVPSLPNALEIVRVQQPT